MKKQLFSLMAVLVAATSLYGCSKPKEEEVVTPEPTPGVEVEAPSEEVEVTEGFTGDATVEALYDATGEKQDMIVTTVTFENGAPVDVNIDVRLEDGTMKSELSASGEYDMKNEGGLAWHEQIDLLEEFIKENNFDLTAVNLIDEDGHTDAVASVSIKVSAYLPAVEQLISDVQSGLFTNEEIVNNEEVVEGTEEVVEGTEEVEAE